MSRGINPLSLEADWPVALERACSDPDVVTPVFQPIVDLSRGRTCGYEGLSRFNGELRAGPAEWFGAAALYGFSARLEALVLRKFLSARRGLPEDCFLSVNASPEGVVSEEVREILEREGDVRGLVLEVTEQTPVDDYDELIDALADWRRAGAQVAVDDAGSGYASLRHILALEPDFVKIDRSLVTGVDTDPRKAAVVSAIGAFADALDAWVVAEGVEEGGELDALIGLRVPLAQGWFLGRPGGEMGPLEGNVAKRINFRTERRDAGGIGALLEHLPAVHEADGQIPAGLVVLLDEHQRPTGIVTVDGNRHPVLGTGLDADAREVALRAMARLPADRFAPVACCDERGRYLGLVRVERLVESLAR